MFLPSLLFPDDLEDGRVGFVEVGGQQLLILSTIVRNSCVPANPPTFCCPSTDMLRMACHCNGCLALTIGRWHARHVSDPKALEVDLIDDMAQGVQGWRAELFYSNMEWKPREWFGVFCSCSEQPHATLWGRR